MTNENKTNPANFSDHEMDFDEICGTIDEIIDSIKLPSKRRGPLLKRKNRKPEEQNPANCSPLAFIYHQISKEIYTNDLPLAIEIDLLKFTYNCTEFQTTNEWKPKIIEMIKTYKTNLKDRIQDIKPLREINYSIHSIKGKRKTMEDKHVAIPYFNKIIGLKDPDLHLFAIFDGHGGDLAATSCQIDFPIIFAQLIEENMAPEGSESTLDFENLLKRAIKNTNDQFLKNTTSLSGSTAVVSLIATTKNAHEHSISSKIYTMWVGDSEAIILDKKFITRVKNLVKAHNLVDPKEIERIKKAGGRVILSTLPNSVPRLNGTIALGRAIGDRDEINRGLACLPDVSIEELNWQVGDQTSKNVDFEYKSFLIIACDGLWDVVSPEDCLNILKEEYKNWDQKESFCKFAIKKLNKQAVVCDSQDNISIILVELEPKDLKITEIKNEEKIDKKMPVKFVEKPSQQEIDQAQLCNELEENLLLSPTFDLKFDIGKSRNDDLERLSGKFGNLDISFGDL